jgi:type VI secretion system secreted protein VgrG
VQLHRADGLVAYRAEVVPSIWFLGLTSDCRIFQTRSVPQIATTVLDKMGISDYRLSLTHTYPPREYCVQYRESDLTFLTRLFEDEGIFFFFEHSADSHMLVIADSPSAVKPGAVAKLAVRPVEAGSRTDPFITELEVGSRVCSGKVTLVDYDETVPKRLESTVSAASKGTGVEQLRVFDYPGKFSVVDEGDRLARVRMEEQESLGRAVTGRTNSAGLSSGHRLEVTDHYRRDVNMAYHLLSLTHHGQNEPYRSETTEKGLQFETTFVAIPHAVPFRPARDSAKPFVHGSQTAIVVGPAGEEMHVDKYGRVKVKFFWDQSSQHDEKTSCWVRVSSGWAGKNWGMVNVPRIGQEVVVDFLEGDPDRPIITGRVYNAEQMPPYALPANGTQSGLKTRSSKGGDGGTANELRFEDKKGSEEILLHAEKDFRTEVEHDESHDVLHDRRTVIKNADTRTVTEGADTLTVEKGDQSIAVAKGKQTITVEQNRVVTISKGSDTLSIKMGDLTTEISQGNQTTKLGVGNVAVKAGAGAIKHEAMQGIELKVGQNSVKIDQTGITIKGMMVKIEGQIQTELKGMMTTVKGDGMLTVKGGITMIN